MQITKPAFILHFFSPFLPQNEMDEVVLPIPAPLWQHFTATRKKKGRAREKGHKENKGSGNKGNSICPQPETF